MTRPLSADDIYRFEIPSDPDLSPDGSQVAYVLTRQDRERDAAVSAIHVVDTAPGRCTPRALTDGVSDTAPRWSPDSTTVAFLRAGQLCLVPAGGGEVRQLTTERSRPAGAGPAVWAPDGTRIAFAAVDAVRDAHAPVVVDGPPWKADGTGLVGTALSQVFVVDVESGRIEQLTAGPDDCAGPVWSPDGSRLAFAATSGPGLEYLGESAPYVIDVQPDVEPGREVAAPRRIGDGIPLTAALCWYPDGSALLVTGRTTLTVGHLNLLRQPLDGSAATVLAAGQDRNVMPGAPGYPGAPAQFHGGDIVFAVRDRGCTRLCRLAAGSDAAEYLDLPPRLGVSGAKVSQTADTLAFVCAGEDTFGEVGLLDLASGKFRRLTEHMATALPGVRMPEYRERTFAVSDGGAVPGWVLRDPDLPPGGPLLVDVHGGPHNAWSPQADWIHLYHHELVALGWTVLLLNIRGSDGYGEAYYRAALGGWGEADHRDVLEPVAALVDEGLADPARIALTGYSYGGFLACWLSARSEIFAAVAAGGVVTDLPGMAGTSDVGSTFALEVGRGDQPVRQSPLTYVDAVRAPTLILHGAEDERCPVGQAELWFQALHARGVDVRMVLYPGASHLFILNGRPSHRVDYSRRVVDWVTSRTAHPDWSHDG